MNRVPQGDAMFNAWLHLLPAEANSAFSQDATRTKHTLGERNEHYTRRRSPEVKRRYTEFQGPSESGRQRVGGVLGG